MPSVIEVIGRSQQQQPLNQSDLINNSISILRSTLENGNISDAGSGGEDSADENSSSSYASQQQSPSNVTLNNNNNNLFNNIIMGEQLASGQSGNTANNCVGSAEHLDKARTTMNGTPRTMSTGGVPIAVMTNRPNSHAFQERRIPLYPNQQAKVISV